MTAAVPLEAANELWNELNRHFCVMDRHMSTLDEQYILWSDRTKTFARAGPDANALCRALIHIAAGDAGSMEMAIGEARKAGASTEKIIETQLIGYSNLSYASKGLAMFRRVVDVRKLNINQFMGVGVSLGAFHGINDLVAQASLAKFDLSSFGELPVWLRAAEILRSANFSDEQCAQVVDVAGEVLRAEELFWLDLQPRVFADDGQGVVLIRFRVATTSARAAEMTGLVVDRLIEQGLDQAPLLVNFVGAAH